jgi:hypothetical protein
MGYIYQADVWCDECGQAIIADLTAQGQAPEDPEDESSFDSGEFPKHYDAESEESDGPENCADGNCAGGHGTFLRNGLTSEGYARVKDMLDKHGEVLPDYAQEWAEFYGFTYWKQPYEHAQEWLQDWIGRLAEETTGRCANELISLARTLAGELDGDKIQEIFQADMAGDDFFKDSGWYSDESY